MATVDILNVLEETNRQMQKLEIGSRGPVFGEAYFGSPPCVRATYFGPPPCELYSDGTSRGNPGTAGIDFLLTNSNGEVTETFSSFLGYQFTNNAAEYKALIGRLQHALNWGITAIKAYGDSELVCRQVNGEYKINKEWLGRYYNTVRKLLGRFQSYEVAQVRREENFIADALANLGIDQRSVDTSPAAKHKVMLRCSTPLGAKHYVLEKRCEGVLQLQFILGTIKSALPKSYAAVRELCSAIKQEKAILPGCQDGSRLKTVCMPCLLAQY